MIRRHFGVEGNQSREKAIQSLNQLAFGTKIEARLTELMDQIIGIDDKSYFPSFPKALNLLI